MKDLVAGLSLSLCLYFAAPALAVAQTIAADEISGTWHFDREATSAALLQFYDEHTVKVGLVAVHDSYITIDGETGKMMFMWLDGNVTGGCDWTYDPDYIVNLTTCEDADGQPKDPAELGTPILFSDGSLMLAVDGPEVIWYRKTDI